ncbi:GTPase activating protein (BUD2/CLA2) [Moelleriella libera RCEF 2490]|uniref:GTPase activating protein (BUD2/CLA2) n=1 Tax=Moelleriella libera RCEF 2490 TaxID=1081109 RepID=A0A166V534_9HYPO|nr:GTPase activating protein (BUD2/CLA2) [Moelleriella libera RCEF 2490]
MDTQTASLDEVVSDSQEEPQSSTSGQLRSPSQPTVPPPLPPTHALREGTDRSLFSAALATAASPRSVPRPHTAEPGISLRSKTPDVITDAQKFGMSSLGVDIPSSVPRHDQEGYQLGDPQATSRRQGMVFDGESNETSAASPAYPGSPTLSQQQRNPGGGARPRTRTLDAAMLVQRTFPVMVDQRHRVGSISSSLSQPLLDEARSTVAAEGIGHSASVTSRLHEQPTPSTLSKPPREKRGGKRLLKKQPSRPNSPLPAPLPSVDSFLNPVDTVEPAKLIMLMKTIGGRMRGNIEYYVPGGDRVWHGGVAYVDDEKACLMFNSSHGRPFFKPLFPDLRGCTVSITKHPDDDRDCIKLLAAADLEDTYLRPVVTDEWNIWLAAFLCWQQTRAPLARSLNGNGATSGNSSAATVTGSSSGSLSASADGPRTATIIKIGTVLLWDKGPTGSANDLVQRSSTRDSLSPAASWRQISSILQDDGDLRLLVENATSSLCVIQLSQLSRCAIQQLDHSVLKEEFCLAIFPFYANTASRLSIFRPVYLALDSRVQFEVWFVLLRAFAVPELYRLDPKHEGPVQEVMALEDVETRHDNLLHRIEKTVGVRVTEAKVRASPWDMEETGSHHHYHQQHALLQQQQSVLEKHGYGKTEQDPLVGNYVAEVILDGEIRARTAIKLGTKNPYWREDCEFSDLPHTVQEVSIVLKRTDATQDATHPSPEANRALGQQEQVYGTVHVGLDKLQRGRDHEDWLQIMDDRHRPIGSMLIKISHAEQIVLLSKEYDPLAETLHRFPSGLTTMISASLPGQLRRLSEIFLNIFQASGNAEEWLMALVEDEIDGIGSQASIKKFRFSNRLKSNESMESASERELLVRDMSKSLAGEANLLFRGNTLLTQSLEFHMRRLGVDYLEVVLQNKINEINDVNPDCEVDTSRLPHAGSADLDQRWSRLIRYTTEVWLCISDSAHSLPSELRHILKYIRAVAEDRYGDFLRTVAYTAVSGFLFLRFICPAILSPKLFGLLRDHPRAHAQRTLTLIAKVLQKMANMSTFGKREEWMERMNRFLTSQRSVFRDYIDQVCGIPAERGSTKTAPAAYSTPIAILGRLGGMAKEGSPSLPYLIDQARSLASLVRLWADAAPEDVKKGKGEGDLLIFNDICLDLQKRADTCVAQIERARAAKAASSGMVEQLAESLEQATLIESLSKPYSLPSMTNDGDLPPGSSGSEGATDEGMSRRRSKDGRRGRDVGMDSRKASVLRQGSGMSSTSKSKNGKVGRTILNGIMRIGGRAESPESKSQR